MFKSKYYVVFCLKLDKDGGNHTKAMEAFVSLKKIDFSSKIESLRFLI